MGCIYLATSPSGKQYVGMTTRTLEERWAEHCYDAKRDRGYALHRAIRKFSPESFKLEVIIKSDDEQELADQEIAQIAARGTLGLGGYNMTTGGDRFNLCAEALAKKAITMATPEYKKKISKASKSLWDDPLRKKLLLATRRVSMAKPEFREAARLNAIAMWAKEGFREKQRETAKTIWACRNLRNKQSENCRSVFARKHPNVFCDGRVFSSMGAAARFLGLNTGAVHARTHSSTKRFLHWHTIPNHNDPACDAVEECWAIMQFAKAEPGHENVPLWASPHGVVPAGFWNA